MNTPTVAWTASGPSGASPGASSAPSTYLAVDGWPWNTVIGVERTNTATLLDGSSYTNTGAHILQVRLGKITAFHAYLHDAATFADALSRLTAHGLAEAGAPPVITSQDQRPAPRP